VECGYRSFKRRGITPSIRKIDAQGFSKGHILKIISTLILIVLTVHIGCRHDTGGSLSSNVKGALLLEIEFNPDAYIEDRSAFMYEGASAKRKWKISDRETIENTIRYLTTNNRTDIAIDSAGTWRLTFILNNKKEVVTIIRGRYLRWDGWQKKGWSINYGKTTTQYDCRLTDEGFDFLDSLFKSLGLKLCIEEEQ